MNNLSLSTEVSLLDGYKAMFYFLDAYYKKVGEPDEIGILLSSMDLSGDGTPRDPAMFSDWLNAATVALGLMSRDK
ncbi:MAG: hypothetical protein ACJ75B_21440 [Flavisolibacter sp.]